MKNFCPGDLVRIAVNYDTDPGIWIAAGVTDAEVNSLLDSMGSLALVQEVSADWATIITKDNARVRWVPNAYLKFVSAL